MNYSNKISKKKMISVVLLMVLLINIISVQPSAYASNKSNIILNGNKLKLDVRPLAVEGRIYVPIRAILEELGMDVTWDQDNNTVIGKNKDNIMKILIEGDDLLDNTYNGIPFYNEDAPTTIVRNGRTLVPVRGIANVLGLSVRWDQANRDVILNETAKKEISLTDAHKILVDKYPTNEAGFNYIYIYYPMGGYAARNDYVLDNYYVFAILNPYIDIDDNGNIIMGEDGWDANWCIDKKTGEIKAYDSNEKLEDEDYMGI